MNDQAALPTLIDTDEVTRMLNVSANTVRRWAREGLIPVVRLPGRSFRFHRSTIEEIATPRVGRSSDERGQHPDQVGCVSGAAN